jgi:hypothetical protein
VLTGIVPKMAIRFTSYEWYKQALADNEGIVTGKATFLGKLLIITHAFIVASHAAFSYQEQQQNPLQHHNSSVYIAYTNTDMFQPDSPPE